MSVLERKRIIGKSDKELDEFTCGICHEILVDPMVTKCCQQTYCRQCIEEWLQRQNTCPNDRKSLIKNDLCPAPRLVVNLLNEMSVKCDYHLDGCQEVVPYSQLSTHLKSCEFNLCKTCGYRGRHEEHKCVDILLAKNNSLMDEMKKLKMEIDELKINQKREADNKLSSMFAKFEISDSYQATKFEPVIGTDTLKDIDTIMKCGVEKHTKTKHQCITCMKEYENLSLEELRHHYYVRRNVMPTPSLFPNTKLCLNLGSIYFGKPVQFTARPIQSGQITRFASLVKSRQIRKANKNSYLNIKNQNLKKS